jgi:hypothetical protein
MKPVLNFVPFSRVGPISLGENVSSIKGVTLEPLENEGIEWDAYSVAEATVDSIRVYVEDGRVTVVSCNDSLIYNGYNLIGIKIKNAESIIGTPADYYEEQEVIDDVFEIYYWDLLGLSLWVDLEGIVDTIDCCEFTED